MKSLLNIVKQGTDYLAKRNIGNARREAEDLIRDALNCSRLTLYTDFDRPLTEHELEICRQRIMRRGAGEPFAYIVGHVEFYNCNIKVTRDVLIPRQETELLVDKIAQELATTDLSGKVLWDLCCGSGCIGIALKKRFPQLAVSLGDLSPKALAIAHQNALANGVEVTLVQGDLLTPFKGKQADFIVCNPPYVSEEEFATLDPEVKMYEPHQALVGGKTGLEFYERLQKDLHEFLKNKGKVWLEIGHSQGNDMKKIFNSPIWKSPILTKDLSGHDRFFFLEKE